MSKEEDYNYLTEFCDRFGVDEEKRGKFIHEAMVGKGYKPRMDYDEPDPEGENGGDENEKPTSLFAKRKAEGDKPPQKDEGKGKGSDWLYA